MPLHPNVGFDTQQKQQKQKPIFPRYTDPDLDRGLYQSFFWVDSEGDVVRKVVVPHDHQLAVSLGDCFLYFVWVYLVFGDMYFVCCCCPVPTFGREDEVNFCHKEF